SIKTDLLISFLESDEVQSKISGVILGEDKMLQNFVVSKDKIIAFKDDTLVMDEKITNNAQVKRQRTRWINTYFQNVNAALRILFKGIRAKSINQIVFSFTSIFPPLFLLVLFSVLILFLDWLLVGFSLPFYLVFGGLVLFTLNFVLTLRFFNAPAKVFRALILVPVFIFYQILALFNLKDSKSDFLVTKKKKITI
ncbi:hypothetical protein KY321_01135, partial [Candidatus Woesearchaeota archaeon]|nr:hypothetical protein [Candidatus Woesearchaeota archaeon]